MILIENPAARLLAILEKGKAIDATQPCERAWQIILDTQRSSDSLFFNRLAKVMELANQASELLENLEVSERFKNANQYWIGQINIGFRNQKLNGQWGTFINHIDERTIDSLATATEHFETKLALTQMPQEKLSEIKSTFQKLLDDILTNEDLDKEIKLYLVRSLQRIIVAIDEHFISGYTPIIEAIETTIGYVALDSKTDDKKVYTAFYETGMAKECCTALNIISAMVTLATGIPQLSTDFIPLLLPLLKD
jgi:transcription termination factor NusB